MHGDIKPSNILIFEEDIGLVAKVIDFGCSCFGSRDDDHVLLSRTTQWAAPEVGDLHMSIEAAKLTDIYSYGMVCAWIFFGQEKPVTDFAGLPPNFDQAAENLMQIGETVLEQSQDTSLKLSTSVRHMRNFFESSFQAAHERRARHVKYLLDQLDFLVIACNTRCVARDKCLVVYHLLTLNQTGQFNWQSPFLFGCIIDRKLKDTFLRPIPTTSI